jgi:hypothetical protein
MRTEPERLLAKHRNVQRAIDVSASHYWGLVRAGKIRVGGSGKGGRAVWSSVRSYVAELEAQKAREIEVDGGEVA